MAPRSYPKLDQITDDAAKESLRLLWDAHYSSLDRITSTEATVGVQETGLQATNNKLDRVETEAREAKELASASVSPSGIVTVPGPVPPDIDDGRGAQGCSQAQANGHPSGDLRRIPRATVAGMIVCGTGNEFPSLLDPAVDQPTRDANIAELLGRVIWHLQTWGLSAGKQRNPSGAISLDKITVRIDAVWRAYDIFIAVDRPFDEAVSMAMQQVFPADPVADGGIAD